MNSGNKRVIKALNDLVATCKDGEKGYGCAAKDVAKHQALGELLNSYSAERAQFAAELLTEVHRLDVAAERKGTVRASAHRGWMNLKSVLPRKGAEVVIAECDRGEHAALKDYQAALKLRLPSEVRALVEKQLARIKEAQERIHAMKAVATLNRLLAICKDGEKGYRSAAAAVAARDLKDLLNGFAKQRARFAAELEAAVHGLGDAARQKGTVAAFLHRGWLKTRAAFARGDLNDVVAECKRGERLALHRYEQALKRELPKEILTLVASQHASIKEACAQLRNALGPQRPGCG